VSIRRGHATAILVSFIVVAPAVAQRRLGSEFVVNSYTTQHQYLPAVTGHEGSGFVIVWSGQGNGDDSGVFGQRYDSFGIPIGGELRVNSYTTGGQFLAEAAMDADGDFVVVWSGSGNGESNFGLFGQRYDAFGSPLGSEFRVNTYTTGLQAYHAVASDPEGNFVVVWGAFPLDPRQGIFARCYDASGNPIGGELQVSNYPGREDWQPAVAMNEDGEFVVVWERADSSGNRAFGLYGQRFDASGNPLGASFLVTTSTTGREGVPAVASDADGGFVVVWHNGPSSNELDVYARRFDASGIALGAEFRVNTTTTGDQWYPEIAVQSDGEFVVVWVSGDHTEVVGRRFDASGSPVGGEFLVDKEAAPNNRNRNPGIAFSAAREFVVAWTSGELDSALDTFGQRFALPDLLLSAAGDCPGSVDVTLSGAPPSSEVSVVAAASTNGFTKGGTVCPGTRLEVGEPFQLPPTFVVVDAEGNGAATLELGADRCFLQALALADCSTSNTVEVQ
jgi:hypothetical protein